MLAFVRVRTCACGFSLGGGGVFSWWLCCGSVGL